MRWKARDLWLARKANKHGARYSLRIILEARKNRVPISTAFAVVEQESNFRNVFGHDPTHSIPPSWKGGQVTKDRYHHYKRNRNKGGMQGVGPMQLTWWEIQDDADRLGGCWRPKWNICVGMDHLGRLLRAHKMKRHPALAAYNGGDSEVGRRNGERYATEVEIKAAKWHRLLT